MWSFIIVFIIVVVVVCLLDLTPMSMDENLERLLYTDQDDEILEASHVEEDNISPFGDSTTSGEVSQANLQDDEAKRKAEELLEEIYNS